MKKDISVNWKKSHIAALRAHWKKGGPGTAMWPFNQQYHTAALKLRSDDALLYVVNAKIPHLSDLAEKVAKQRGLMKKK